MSIAIYSPYTYHCVKLELIAELKICIMRPQSLFKIIVYNVLILHNDWQILYYCKMLDVAIRIIVQQSNNFSTLICYKLHIHRNILDNCVR